MIVAPRERAVHWLARKGEGYEPISRSALIDLGADQLAERIDWPADPDDAAPTAP